MEFSSMWTRFRHLTRPHTCGPKMTHQTSIMYMQGKRYKTIIDVGWNDNRSSTRDVDKRRREIYHQLGLARISYKKLITHPLKRPYKRKVR